MPKKRIYLNETQIKQIIKHIGGFIPSKSPFGNCLIKQLYFKQEHSKSKFLFEGLISSYPIEKVLKHIKNYLNFTDSYTDFTNTTNIYNGFICTTHGDNNESLIEVIYQKGPGNTTKINDVFKLCGYYCIDEIIYEGGFIHQTYAKKHQDVITKGVMEGFPYLYHITLSKHITKIKQQGLTPRNRHKKTNNPERIYFLLNNNVEDNKAYAMSLFPKNNEWKNAVLITIKTKGLINKFYYDPYMENAVYTTENIPKQNIVEFKKILGKEESHL